MSSTRNVLAGSRILLDTISSTASRTRPAHLPTRTFSRLPQTSLSLSSRSALHTSASKMAQPTVDSQFIHDVTKKENELTGQPEPVKGGPIAQAQKHTGQKLDGDAVSGITKGETKITQQGGPVAGGPAALAESGAAKGAGNQETHSGVLDSDTISRITHAESGITGQDEPVKGGPTAQAQKHAGEPIGSENLHDITEGEKKVTGGERFKGGPTATAQSELAKSRA